MPYFDKEKLKRKIISEYGINLTYSDVCQSLKELPDEDVAPVKHGYWIEVQKHNGRKTIQCSECKRVLNVDGIQPEYLGCPMCLAKMDKEKVEKENI